MSCLGVRGATVADANTPEAICEAARELLLAIVNANGIQSHDIAAAYFTATPDLTAAFPASAARSLGWHDVALLDAQAPAVPGDPERCIRVLILWNNGEEAAAVKHVYLKAASRLRPDRV